MCQRGLLAESPARLLRVPKAAKTIVPTLIPDQMGKILAAMDATTPAGFRDLCVMMTLLDTEVRLSELVNLQLPNLISGRSLFQSDGQGSERENGPNWKEGTESVVEVSSGLSTGTHSS